MSENKKKFDRAVKEGWGKMKLGFARFTLDDRHKWEKTGTFHGDALGVAGFVVLGPRPEGQTWKEIQKTFDIPYKVGCQIADACNRSKSKTAAMREVKAIEW